MATFAALLGSLLVALSMSRLGAPAAAAAEQPEPLRFGTFNVRSVKGGSPMPNERPWKDRRKVVISQILGERLDVLGIQEASQNAKYAGRLVDGKVQYLDLRNGLNKAGGHFQLTNVDPNASRSTRILYNTQTVTRVRSGAYAYQHQSGLPNDTRYLTWAIFQQRSSGKRFFFANTHLANKSAGLQQAQWEELIAQVQRLKSGLPVVVVGDFQSSRNRQPAATMMVRMRSAGYGDVLGQSPLSKRSRNTRAASIVRGWVNSVNHFKRDVADFSNERNRHVVGNNADWVFASNNAQVLGYKTVLKMKKLRLRGVIPSDHNLVRATLRLR